MKRAVVVGLISGAISVLLAASAVADVTVWLVNGVEPTSKVLATSESMGTLVVQDMSNTTPAQVNCLGVTGEGWVGPGSEGEVTAIGGGGECVLNGKAENLKGEQVANSCTALNKVEVVNLPWKSLVELINNVTYVLILPGTEGGAEPGFKVECTTTLGLVADTCNAAVGSEVNGEASNDIPGGNVLIEGLKTLLNASEAAKCSIGGAEEGLVVGGDGLITVPGGTLAFGSH